MLRLLGVLLCFTGICSVPHSYIVVRLSDSDPLVPISAQFELHQPANSTRVWDCVSGLTPIEYPKGDELVVKAQSIDMNVGEVVECLGLSVRVVRSEHVPRWEGEDTTCPGLLTSTTQLERSDSGSTEYFRLAPPTSFHVFVSKPSAACIREHVQLIPPPELVFSYQNKALNSCEVDSQYLHLMTCNLTISTRGGDIISLAVGTPSILIPQYIFSVGVDALLCNCRCEILNSDSKVVREKTITYKNESRISLPPELETYHTHAPSAPLCKDLVIVICVISFFLLTVTMVTVFLLNLTRDLKRKLARATGRRCRITGMKKPPGTPDQLRPDMEYSRVHRFTNECHHYNTLSLRLSDCGKDSVITKSQTFPVYQKLCFNEQDETL
jgi:hypothetical protein